MEALLAIVLTLAPMHPTPEEVLTKDLMVCRHKAGSEEVECVEYEAFQAALRQKLLESPKRGEL